MIIPDPEFKLIRKNLAGLSLVEAWNVIRTKPPQLELTRHYTIILDDGMPLVQPVCFVTDLASIPRLLWAVPGFSPTGPLAYGAIPHDFGYQHGYLLTFRQVGVPYPEPSIRLYEQFPEVFGEFMPIFVGRNQRFFDDLLGGITREATGATVIAGAAECALHRFGDQTWNNYRTKGPAAYNDNSLGLPGLLANGGYAF